MFQDSLGSPAEQEEDEEKETCSLCGEASDDIEDGLCVDCRENALGVGV